MLGTLLIARWGGKTDILSHCLWVEPVTGFHQAKERKGNSGCKLEAKDELSGLQFWFLVVWVWGGSSASAFLVGTLRMSKVIKISDLYFTHSFIIQVIKNGNS